MPHITTKTCERLYFEDSGYGPPLVFVHGWSYSGVVWHQSREYFSERYRCIVVDLPGHGQSSPAVSGYNLESLADALNELIVQLNLVNAVVVGWSLGALITLAASSLLQGRVSAMALIAGTAKFTLSEGYPCGLAAKEVRGLSLRLRRNRQVTLDGFFELMFSAEDLEEVPSSLSYRSLVEGRIPLDDVLLGTLEVLSVADVRDRLSGISIPVLILHGEGDRICPPAAARYMADRITSARLLSIPGCGHAPFLSRTQDFVAALRSFLETVYDAD